MPPPDSDLGTPLQTSGRHPWPDAWTARGVIEVLEPMVIEARQRRIREVIEQRVGSVTLVLDGLHDPHNGAAILRSCDAFGVQEVHIVSSGEPFVSSNLVSKGTERWVDIVEHSKAESAAQDLAGRGFELVATHPQGTLTPDQLATLPRLALIMGNEHHGISPALVRAAGRSVRVPMVGFVESLNVSVSAAILVHAATQGRTGDMSPSERERLYARGLFHTVKRSAEVLAAIPPR